MINRNSLLLILLTIYTLIGSWLSINTGISHDEFHEQLNWEVNLQAINDFFNTGEYSNLINYRDKYHGIAFQFLSQPIQIFLSNFVAKVSGASLSGAHLISKHVVVFLIFSISSIFFYLISLKISNNFKFSILTTLIYLFYPYFFGHAQINPKDIPFMSFWLINTYIFFRFLENLYIDKPINMKEIIVFSFFTAFLISIRISGVVIFLQYFIGLIILYNYKKLDIKVFLKRNGTRLFYFLLFLIFFLFILNPIFWHNPFEFFNSIKLMGKYQQNLCTLTLGDCMESLNLPSNYYFIWLFFKLPILIIFGILLFPLIEKKIFSQDPLRLTFYLTLFITPLIIILVFIFKDVALYDEIRHIMFIIPMIFLASLLNIYILNDKLFYTLTVSFVLFFILENFSINPYQYTWLNSFAKFNKIDKSFEVDYWGVSNKSLQNEIIKFSKLNSLNKNTCVYGDTYVKEFLIKHNFKCFKSYSELDAAKVRPYFVYQNVRNLKRSSPKDCKLVLDESYKYSFSNQKIKVANLWYCI